MNWEGLPWWLRWWRICLPMHRRREFDPQVRRSPGGGHGNPPQYSCLENPMDRGAWPATVMGSRRVGHDLVTKKQQWLSETPLHKTVKLSYSTGSHFSFFPHLKLRKRWACFIMFFIFLIQKYFQCFSLTASFLKPDILLFFQAVQLNHSPLPPPTYTQMKNSILLDAEEQQGTSLNFILNNGKMIINMHIP